MSVSQCPACGVHAVHSVPITAEGLSRYHIEVAEGVLSGVEHTCRYCGEFRVTVSRATMRLEEQIELYPCANGPTLRHVEGSVALENGDARQAADFYVDEIPVEASYWFQRLADRRRMRTARVSN